MTVLQVRCRALVVLVLALVVTALAHVAPAFAAAPGWTLTSLAPTAVAPGGKLTFAVAARDTGSAPTDGSEIVSTAKLPAGMRAVSAEVYSSLDLGSTGVPLHHRFPCHAGDGVSPVAGAGEVRCVDSEVLPDAHELNTEDFQDLILTVAVDPGAAGTLTTSFSVAGGGGAEATSVDPTLVTNASTLFGVDAFDMQLLDGLGAPALGAGTHPADVVTQIDLNTVPYANPAFKGPAAVEPVRDVSVDLPAGLVGNPTVAAHCTSAQLIGKNGGLESRPSCPSASQVGEVFLRMDGAAAPNPVANVIGPVGLFNMDPPTGAPARFGFSVLGSVAFLTAKLRPDRGYALSINSSDITQVFPLAGVETVFWGVPGSPAHDAVRGCPDQINPQQGGPSCPGSGLEPFFRNPTSCSAEDLPFELHVDSWGHPGAVDASGNPDLADPNWKSSAIALHAPPGYPAPREMWGPGVTMEDCARVPVAGELSAAPSTAAADSTAGLTVHVNVPNSGLETANGVATSDVKAIKVELPEGVKVNPSQANGLTACSPAQYASTEANPPAGATTGCPASSRIGSILLHTPLLEEPVEGSVFVASQYENPFHSLLALYVVLDNPARGVLIKLPGRVDLDPSTGRLVTVFDNMPQLPFSSFDFRLREGARAPLSTPSACGTYTTRAWFTPWSNPSSKLESDSTFDVSSGPGGSPCPPGGVPGFGPSVVSGTASNAAGQYSPFVLQLTRNDGEQGVSGLTFTMPPGVAATLADVSRCSDQDAAAATCPASSRIGTVTVASGVGSEPVHLKGSVYLTGPYNGGPFGEVTVVPAVAGPFNLGNVIVRGSIRIDSVTAQPTVVSDPFPQFVGSTGIPSDIRSVKVTLDRSAFSFNPTSCRSLSVTGSLTGALGASAPFTNHFQATGCDALAFKPSFTVSTQGNGTFNRNGASLDVKITTAGQGAGSASAVREANIAKVETQLPKMLPSRLTTLQKACTETQFAQNPAGCPAASKVGTATARTPDLTNPLSGPAFLVSHGGRAFPDLVLVLQGEGITLNLTGHTQIKNGITYSRFETVPDAPISSFELKLPEGPYSALAAFGNLCGTTKTTTKKVRRHGHAVKVKTTKHTPPNLAMPTTITAQNSAVVARNTKIAVTGCAAVKTKAKKAKAGKSTRR